MTSTERGLLIPRVDLDDATTAAPVTSPAEGLLIYNETGTEPHGFYYWDGTIWIMFDSGSSSSSGFVHYIGELYGGGIIVSVWKESGVEHGLIASLDNVGAVHWNSNTGTAVIGAGSFTDGQTNTADMITDGDTDGAAYLCDNYAGGGFTDWYLPAVLELTQCYNAAFVVNNVLATGDFTIFYYWSSTVFATTQAWYHNFKDGSIGSGGAKTSTYRVRAVRKF